MSSWSWNRPCACFVPPSAPSHTARRVATSRSSCFVFAT
nr:MAG TPA: hypothetical protein [Caudoviricetes sp.]